MSVLDELREQFRIKRGNWQSITPPENYAEDRARGLTDAIAIVDAFEAAHPGLVDDRSGPCACSCGAIYWRGDVLRVCPACAKAATP